MKVSVNNGASYTTAEDISDDDLTTYWAALEQMMDDSTREAVDRIMEHESWEDVECEPRKAGDELRGFLRHYLERAPHDLVIG